MDRIVYLDGAFVNEKEARISPNDRGRTTYCLCENCRAWDAPDGKLISSWGPDGPIQHVSLTDRYVKLYTAIAEIVAKELHDRYLCGYAYHEYSLSPVHAKLHPNVVIGLVLDPDIYLIHVSLL